VSNAVKFTSTGEIVIRLEHETIDETTIRVFAKVRDTGIGLSAAALTRMFQPFVQADGSMSRRFGGTGLGLSISRRLAEMMGGSIEVESTENIGSTFIVSVVARLPPRAAGDGSSNRTFRRALVIANRESSRVGLVSQLEAVAIQCESTTRASARAFLEDVDQPSFDLVLVDGDDELDARGIDLGRGELKTGRAANSRIVCATMDRSDSAAKRLFAAGIDRVVHKPLIRSRLHQALETVESGGERVTRPSESSKPLPARKARILVVEDNPVNQRVATALLKTFGVDSEVAENGEVALRMVAASSFDAVFMDCQMPVMDGLTATRELRRREKDGKRLPVIALTANVSTDGRTACVEAGMDDFLSKPLLRDAIRIVLQRWVDPVRTLEPVSNDAFD
jgi:CheY-like chemotaxis protein